MSQDHESLENLLSEDRLFPPSAEFAAQANAKPELYDKAEKDRLAFWDEQAKQLTWQTPWNKLLIGSHLLLNGLLAERSTPLLML